MSCSICSNKLDFFSHGNILNKYKVAYFRCNNCGLVQTESPFWLEEAYSQPINQSDVGLVNRNLTLANISKSIINTFFNRNKKFIDYGGGYGLLTRLMRDSGFDFYWFDKYCQNLFAKEFEADMDVEKSYELLTAFEILEHVINPHDEIERMLKLSDNILFSTVLLPANNPKPGDWWYYGLDHGQHLSFYTDKSLQCLANDFGSYYFSNGSIHLFSKYKINRALFKLFSNQILSGVLAKFMTKKSLLERDYMLIQSMKNGLDK